MSPAWYYLWGREGGEEMKLKSHLNVDEHFPEKARLLHFFFINCLDLGRG